MLAKTKASRGSGFSWEVFPNYLATGECCWWWAVQHSTHISRHHQERWGFPCSSAQPNERVDMGVYAGWWLLHAWLALRPCLSFVALNKSREPLWFSTGILVTRGHCSDLFLCSVFWIKCKCAEVPSPLPSIGAHSVVHVHWCFQGIALEDNGLLLLFGNFQYKQFKFLWSSCHLRHYWGMLEDRAWDKECE